MNPPPSISPVLMHAQYRMVTKTRYSSLLLGHIYEAVKEGDLGPNAEQVTTGGRGNNFHTLSTLPPSLLCSCTHSVGW
jgi:hypothetical protein